MVRVVDCHAGVLGLNPWRFRIFSPWNYFTSTMHSAHCLQADDVFLFIKRHHSSLIGKIEEIKWIEKYDAKNKRL